MKTFNIKSWVKSPRVQKWGLFGLLAISLGFNLSMNPEHFNNIARNEKPEVFQSNELASSAAETTNTEAKVAAATATTPTPTAAALAATATPNPAKVYINEGDKKYEVTLSEFSFDGKSSTIARIQAMCKECKETPPFETVILKSNLKDLEKVIEEVSVLKRTPVVAESDKTTKAAAKAEKKGERTTADLVDLAKKCEAKSGDEAIMSCHKKTLIELSKDLLNSSETEELITSYFDENIKPYLVSGFREPTFNLFTREMNDGLERAREMAADLREGLRGKNGKTVLKKLIALETKSYPDQLNHARAIVRRGLDTGDLDMQNFGMRLMQEPILRMESMQTLGSMFDSFQSNRGLSSAEKAAFTNYATSNFAAPTDRLLNELRSLNRTIPKQGQTYAGLYAQFDIPFAGFETNPERISISGFRGSNSVLDRLWEARVNSSSSSNPLYSSHNYTLPSQSSVLLGHTSGGCDYSPLQPTHYSNPNECGRYINNIGTYQGRNFGRSAVGRGP